MWVCSRLFVCVRVVVCVFACLCFARLRARVFVCSGVNIFVCFCACVHVFACVRMWFVQVVFSFSEHDQEYQGCTRKALIAAVLQA